MQAEMEREQQPFSLICDSKLIVVSLLVLTLLGLCLDHHCGKYFIYICLTNNFLYPILRARKSHYHSFWSTLLRGTFLFSLLYDVWAVVFPHKIALYYLPEALGLVGKIYHILAYEEENCEETVQQIMKMQSKGEIFVLFYCLMSFVFRLRFSWHKLLKLALFALILRAKYAQHYATQLAYKQLHFQLDRYAKFLGLREYYHTFYLKMWRVGVVRAAAQEFLF